MSRKCTMTRSDVALTLGIGIETLRYYERLGLIGEPPRTSNGYRTYSERDVSAIDHILHIKRYGFTLREIKAMIAEVNQDKDFKARVIREKVRAIQKIVRGYQRQKRDLLAVLRSVSEESS